MDRKLNKNRPFNNIAGFKWSELDGKTLKIQVVKSPDGEIVAGKDENGKIYILDINVKKER
jgi:hypothetical protein